MKTLLVGIMTFFGFLAMPEPADDIVNAIKAGKVTELVKYFDAKVSVKIINQEDLLSRAQAEANLKYFFDKHPVKSFSSTHKSSVNNSSQYITGRLETTNGNFRVSILIRSGMISQMRIESENE